MITKNTDTVTVNAPTVTVTSGNMTVSNETINTHLSKRNAPPIKDRCKALIKIEKLLSEGLSPEKIKYHLLANITQEDRDGILTRGLQYVKETLKTIYRELGKDIPEMVLNMMQLNQDFLVKKEISQDRNLDNDRGFEM